MYIFLNILLVYTCSVCHDTLKEKNVKPTAHPNEGYYCNNNVGEMAGRENGEGERNRKGRNCHTYTNVPWKKFKKIKFQKYIITACNMVCLP